ncbi:hypothetical protein ACFE04_019040 [Oxalis oulophora]
MKSKSAHKNTSKTPQPQVDIELAKCADGNSLLPDKFFIKQQFAVGVNDVTRVLERMPPLVHGLVTLPQRQPSNRKLPSLQLQAVLVAADCNPRGLTKDLLTLASSRGVSVIFVKDKKGGSLRLGELVKLKTAMAIGIKAKGNAVNGTIEKILLENGANLGSELIDSTQVQRSSMTAELMKLYNRTGEVRQFCVVTQDHMDEDNIFSDARTEQAI